MITYEETNEEELKLSVRVLTKCTINLKYEITLYCISMPGFIQPQQNFAHNYFWAFQEHAIDYNTRYKYKN